MVVVGSSGRERGRWLRCLERVVVEVAVEIGVSVRRAVVAEELLILLGILLAAAAPCRTLPSAGHTHRRRLRRLGRDGRREAGRGAEAQS